MNGEKFRPYDFSPGILVATHTDINFILTCQGQLDNKNWFDLPCSSYSVTREYKDFLTLHAFLAFTYTKEGVIVPPPPAAESLKTVATVASLSPDEDLSASSASQVSLSR